MDSLWPRLLVATLAAAVANSPRTAECDNGNGNDLEVVLWSVPTLATYVVLHEYSHAAGAKLVGAKSVTTTWLPNPPFGPLGVTGMYKPGATSGDYALFAFAPLITDAVLVGTYGLVSELGGLPSSKHVQIPLTLLPAYGLANMAVQAVPFVSSGSRHVEKVYDHFNLSQWQRLPFRLVHVAAVVGGGYLLWRGWKRIDDGDAPAEPAQAIGFGFGF